MKTLTAIYCRLSKEDGDKEESNSIESQRRILNAYIADHSELELYQEYVDDGCTGTNFQRPGFQSMLMDAQEKKFSCIIVKDLSRLGRNYLETGRYTQQIFPQLGIRFIAINDNVDTERDSQQGFDMMLPIRNIFNESYSQDISRKVQSSFKAMQKAGAFCGSHTSYGYCKNPTDKHKLVIDPYAAAVVKDIYSWYLSGMGQRSIAARLNEMGISCPSIHKKENGENYRNNNRLETTSYWTYSTVHRILQNAMYKGSMVQNKTVRRMRGRARYRPKEEWIIVDRTHEAIIDPETWERVQELLKKRTRVNDFHQNVSIFAGFLKCADCGRAMVKRKSKGGYIYSCGAYSRSGTKVCTSHFIRHSVLEKIILDDINTVIANVEDIKSLVESQSKEGHTGAGQIEKEIHQVKEKLQKTERMKREIYLDYKEGLLSKEEYLNMREEYQSQEEFLHLKLEKFKEQSQEEPEKILDSPWIQNLLTRKHIDELDRETIVEFIERIEVGEKNENHEQKITIHYLFSDELKDLFQIFYKDGGKNT